MKYTLYLFIILMVTSLRAEQKSVSVDGIAARINNHIVTVSDVMSLVEPRQERLGTMYSGQKLKDRLAKEYGDALQSQIDKWLIIDSFNNQKLTIPDWLVQKRANEYIQNNFKGDKSRLTSILARDRMTYSDWLAEIKNHIIVASMRGENVEKHVKVTPKEVKDAYDKNTQEFLKPMRMKLRMIVLDADASGQDASKKELAAKVLKQIVDGEKFETLAKKYSNDATAEFGGDWGWVEPAVKLRKELIDPVGCLKKGEVSGIIEASDAYFIVKCEDIEQSAAKSFEEVQSDIEKQLRQKNGEKLYAEWIERLKKDAFVKIYDVQI